MRTLLAVVIALGLAVPARAENWAAYGGNEFFQASLDLDSMAVKGDGVLFWTKWNISSKGRAEMFDGKPHLAKRASAIKMKWAAICVGPNLRVAEFASYVYDKKSVLLGSNVLPAPVERDLVPGSLMEAMHRAACTAALAKMERDAKSPASRLGSGEYRKKGAVATVKADGKNIEFSLNSAVGDHVCLVEGTATKVDERRAAYSPSDPSDPCVVLLAFSPGQIKVTTKQCEGYCGVRAAGSLDGVYARK